MTRRPTRSAYARKGRMDAAIDYCRQIIADMEFNKRQFKAKSRDPFARGRRRSLHSEYGRGAQAVF